jgi:hypothetical protein
MSFIAAALIGGGAALVGGYMASQSVSDAADTQAASTASGIGEQRRQYDLTRGDYAPYREAGARALGGLEAGINQPFTGAEAMAEPGYQFGLEQGQQALDRKAAAAGGRVSGAALKAASEYGTNYATTGYNAAYQRRQDRLNRLAALAGIGQSATGSSAQAGSTAAGNISGLISGQGNAAAAGQLAQGNIWGNTANQLGAIGKKWASTPTEPEPYDYKGAELPASLRGGG